MFERRAQSLSMQKNFHRQQQFTNSRSIGHLFEPIKTGPHASSVHSQEKTAAKHQAPAGIGSITILNHDDSVMKMESSINQNFISSGFHSQQRLLPNPNLTSTYFTNNDHAKVAGIITKRVNNDKFNSRYNPLDNQRPKSKLAQTQAQTQAHTKESKRENSEIKLAEDLDIKLDHLYSTTSQFPGWRVRGGKSQKALVIEEMLVTYTKELRSKPDPYSQPYVNASINDNQTRLPKILQKQSNNSMIIPIKNKRSKISKGSKSQLNRMESSTRTALRNFSNMSSGSGGSINQLQQPSRDPKNITITYKQVKLDQNQSKVTQEENEILKDRVERRQPEQYVKIRTKQTKELKVKLSQQEKNGGGSQSLSNLGSPAKAIQTIKQRSLTTQKKPAKSRLNQKLTKQISFSPQKDNQQSPSAVEETEFETVDQLLHKLQSKHKYIKSRRDLQSSLRMKGGSTYQIPDKKQVRKVFHQTLKQVNRDLVDKLAKEESTMNGIISLTDTKTRHQVKQEYFDDHSSINKYVNHFSNVADILEGTNNGESSSAILGFASQIQEQVKTQKVKLDIKNAIKSLMIKTQEARIIEENPESPELKSPLKKEDSRFQNREFAFNKTLEEETKQMSFIADTIKLKQNYQRKYNGREVAEIKDDPRIQFFNSCKKDQNLVLPILDKIWKKTLCLQNYFLSEGNIKGLASACEVLDHKLVNRLLLNNNGITGDQFAEVLRGMGKLRDFKSLIYKQNAINMKSLQIMRPVFQKRLPHQLEELKLIDCKVSPALLSKLLEDLTEVSQIKKVALVNMHHNAQSFDKVIDLINECETLQELDLSWSTVPRGSWLKLAPVLNENRTLKNLSLAYNHLLEDQSFKLTQQQIKEGLEKPPLTDKNALFMESLKNFIKYNPLLIHLDLQTCGFPDQIIRIIGVILTRATALQAIHLCGNPGITDQIIEELRTRIRAKEVTIPTPIVPLPKSYTSKASAPQPDSQKPTGLMSLFGMGKPKAEPVDPNKEWKELRAGLKLQSIISSKRMNETVHQTVFDKKQCIITRHNGQKLLIPGSGQWKIITDQKDECWYCGQHILTLFIWSPRIGQLTELKDKKAVKHFKDQFDHLEASADFLPQFSYTPQISSNFTEWRPKSMREVISFTQENDPDPPDFTHELALDNLIKNPKKLTAHEQRLIQAKLDVYYEQYWSSVIVSITEFKNPLVANAHALTSISAKIDESNQVFFHVDWVRPGRHTFVVEHDQSEVFDHDDHYGIRKHNSDIRFRQGTNNGKRNFFVHEMLTSLRTEPVPIAFKTRHTHTSKVAKFTPKPIFDNWISDTPESLYKVLTSDLKNIDLVNIANGDKKDALVIERHLIERFFEIKEIYHYLQGQTNSYPTIDTSTMRNKFIKALKIDLSAHSMSKYEVIMRNVQRAEIKDSSDNVIQKTGFNRFMFMEVCLRLARDLYLNNISGIVDQYDPFQKVSKAFLLFYDGILIPFKNSIDINWQAFRDDKLNDESVELVFTMNIQTVDRIYNRYAKLNQGTEWKGFNQQYLCIIDCIQLLKIDSRLKLTKRMVRQAFALSKQTVTNEIELDGAQQYLNLSKIEFYEFLARIAELLFVDSEMAELPLCEKVEYVLDDIFPLIDEKRIKQVITVQEFSDSDDDY